MKDKYKTRKRFLVLYFPPIQSEACVTVKHLVLVPVQWIKTFLKEIHLEPEENENVTAGAIHKDESLKNILLAYNVFVLGGEEGCTVKQDVSLKGGWHYLRKSLYI